MDDKLVETVAAHIYDGSTADWHDISLEACRSVAIIAIQAHTAYMEENGLVVVPSEPTEAMKEAWDKGWTHNMDCGGATNDWRNMISAAQKEQG